MLVGTDRGLNRFHDGRFVTDPAFAALSRDRVWSIYPESPDTLWIATRGAGLVRVRERQDREDHDPRRPVEQLDFPGDRRWPAAGSG